MKEKKSLPIPVESKSGRKSSSRLKFNRFEVSEGEFLRLHVEAIDSIGAVDERGALYVVRFLDKQGTLIDAPYLGTSLSKTYGRFIYIRSYHESEPRIRRLSDFIVAPREATILEVEVYPFKASKNLRFIGEIRCFSLSNEPTVYQYCELEAEQKIELSHEVFPFWSSLYVFSIEKEQIISDDVEVKIVFLGQDNKAINMNTFMRTRLLGKVSLADNGVLIEPLFNPVKNKQEGHHVEAFIEILPPKHTKKITVTITNHAKNKSIIATYKLYKFSSLVESRFDPDDFTSKDGVIQLPFDVAHLSFLELLNKRSNITKILDAGLNFYRVLGSIERLTSIANHILNVSTNTELYSKARLALSEVRASAPSWFPSPGKVGVNESAEGEKLTIAHFMSTPDFDRIRHKQDAESARAIAIMPLGYPQKGESGEPWERSEEDGVDCFYLNCVSAEQLELVPVTSQLNFMAVLAKDILRKERVDLIHIHEDEDSIDSLLVGVALAKAFKIPLVYQKHTVVDEVVTEFDETKFTLAQAKLSREYQCIQIADAIIVQSEAQGDALVKAGIQRQKISILPLTEDVAKGYMEVYALAQQTHLNKS